MSAQLDQELAYEFVQGGERRGIETIELVFDDSAALLRRDRERGVIVGSSEQDAGSMDCVARVGERKTADLIVRQLKRPETDRVYLKALRVARRLATRIA
jgi:hypothetical protein